MDSVRDDDLHADLLLFKSLYERRKIIKNKVPFVRLSYFREYGDIWFKQASSKNNKTARAYYHA